MSGLHRLAADLGRAAAGIEQAAVGAVLDAATAVETQARALDVERGVVIVQPGPTTAVIASTQRFGVYGNGASAPTPRADLSGVGDRLADRLGHAGVAQITGRP